MIIEDVCRRLHDSVANVICGAARRFALLPSARLTHEWLPV